MKIPIVKCHQIFLFLCSELLRIPQKLWKTQGVLRKKAGKGVRSRFCTLRKCGRSSLPPPSLQELPFFLFFLLFMRKWRLNCRTNWTRKLLDKIPESETATSLNIKTAMSFFFFFLSYSFRQLSCCCHKMALSQYLMLDWEAFSHWFTAFSSLF